MSKFRVNKTSGMRDIPNKHQVDDAKLSAFGKGAFINTEHLSPDDTADQSFTVPINEYHLNILRLLKEKEQRSQRKIAERLLAKAIRDQWDFYKVEPK